MQKKIDMALFSILRAYAARVYKSTKGKAAVQSDRPVEAKDPLAERTSSKNGAESDSDCETKTTTNKRTGK